MTLKTNPEEKAIEEKKQKLTSYYNRLLKTEFEKETDRGAVILAASLFDIQLESLLRTYLIAETSSSDQLFEGASGPLSNFSSKIILCYRLGLISKKFARDLNLIRRIRNEFAHNIHGCSFDHSSVVSRVNELVKSSEILKKAPSIRKKMPIGTRGDFLICASWMLWALSIKIEKTKTINECADEFGYREDMNEKDIADRRRKSQEAKK